jgi:hypothetical protein
MTDIIVAQRPERGIQMRNQTDSPERVANTEKVVPKEGSIMRQLRQREIH